MTIAYIDLNRLLNIKPNGSRAAFRKMLAEMEKRDSILDYLLWVEDEHYLVYEDFMERNDDLIHYEYNHDQYSDYLNMIRERIA